MKKYKVIFVTSNGVTFTITHDFDSWITAFSIARHYKKKYDLVREITIKEIEV